MLGRLLPERFATAVANETRERFLQKWGDTCFLLFVAESTSDDLASGLMASTMADGDGSAVRPSLDAMSRTQMTSASMDIDRAKSGGSIPPSPRVDASLLADRLSLRPNIVAPLRKRHGAKEDTPDRILVGRGASNDVVLRHPSVSKIHAWFELDDFGTFYVGDFGSKNGTMVNRELRSPNETTALVPGDTIHFGSVEALLCPPAALWDLLHAR